MAKPKQPTATRAATKSPAPRTPPLPYYTKVPNSAVPATPVKSATSAGELPESLRAPIPKPIDPSSPAYKAASRKYIGFMVAMPILLVTSYVLFDRLALGHEAKSLKNETPTKDADAV
ncbi:hypothetical protein BJ166DRAFT_589613 [Pestalotiopsis sp. NC0098]|nr:hypothetical protein BJ166DRAFT_589613 [Pestalotiopsis sp. NC0098]